MKKIFLSAFIILTFVVYAVDQRKTNSVVSTVTPTVALATTNQLSPSQPSSGSQSTGSNLSTSSVSSGSNSSQPSTQSNSGSQTASTGLKDGTYTGDVADAFYGNVQVKVTINNGKLTDVQFLDYPHDRSNSMRISNQAMPMLRSEAIQAQSANVDTISGATAISGAFQQSLQSALSQAAG